MARQRQFKDSTSVFPDSAASGAEPESPSAREDWNGKGWRLGIRDKSEREGAVGEW